MNYTHSIEHNTGLFRFKLCLYICATRFSLYLGHSQAYKYKNLRKEDIIKPGMPLGFYYTFLYKISIVFNSISVVYLVMKTRGWPSYRLSLIFLNT